MDDDPLMQVTVRHGLVQAGHILAEPDDLTMAIEPGAVPASPKPFAPAQLLMMVADRLASANLPPFKSRLDRNALSNS